MGDERGCWSPLLGTNRQEAKTQRNGNVKRQRNPNGGPPQKINVSKDNAALIRSPQRSLVRMSAAIFPHTEGSFSISICGFMKARANHG